MRRIPSKYVYHISPSKNRESILKQGLLPKNNINFKDSPSLNHPPCIFVSINEPLWKVGTPNTDVWKIDTTKIKNKWWNDMNAELMFRGENLLMTFEKIEKSSIELEHSY
jgi:hypothetical protein